MKTENNSPNLKHGRLFPVKTLALTAGLIASAATGLSQTLYTNITGDFNVAASWNPNGVPSGTVNATDDNGTNNVVLIQPGDPVWAHGDTLAGNSDNTGGKYIQTGSTNNTGGGNWLRMGVGNNSYGYYYLSNGVVNVGGRTQIGEHGTGYLEIDGGTYNGNVNDNGANPGMVCGQGDFGAGTGTLVINAGTVTYGRETWFGEQGGSGTGTGYFYMNGGTLNVNDWFVFGRNGGNRGAHGYGVMTAGTITLHGGGQFLIGGGGVGSLAQSGGTISVYNQYLVPQSDGGTNGSGTNTLSGSAVLNAHGWLAVGRNGGYGELNISGNAAINRDNSTDGGSHFDIGAGGKGVVNQNGGTITESTSDVYLGESGSGTWNLNAGTALLQKVIMCVNSTATGQLNLNGGLFQTAGISSPTTGAAISMLNWNGGTLQANANNASFINGLYQVAIGSGPVTIDSQNFNITIPQPLVDAGGGTLTKIGSGTVTLSGANSYSGTTAVNAGTLATTTASSGGGAYTVANGATLNIQVVGGLNSQIGMAGLSFTGSATTLGIDLDGFGNPNSAPINVSGALTASGTVTINISDNLPQFGQFPLIAYASKTGSSFVLGSLPFGVAATLVDNTANNSIDLKITAVNLPRWDGNAGGNWDINVTKNWVNIGDGTPTYYLQGNAVTFDDNATGTTTVNLVAAVTPSSVTINNNSKSYTLAGTGSINGTLGITKQGTGTFAFNNVNGYTGATVVANGTLSVNNLANGGTPSAIGASSSNAANLVLAGGNFAYTGPAASVNRGYTTTATNSSITTTGNLTLSGVVTAADLGGVTKLGAAKLTYAAAGSNVLSGATSPGFVAQDGTVVFDGSNGGQTNLIQGTHLAADGAAELATVAFTNTTVNTTGNLDIADKPSSTGAVTINNGSTVNVGSWLILGDASGANATLTMNGGTLNTASGRFFLCSSPGSTATFNMNGGTINKSGDYFAIVNGNWNGSGARSGVVNQTGGIINCASECWIGDAGGANNGSVGTYNLSGGTLSVSNWFGIGRDGSTGIFHMTGGTLNKSSGGDMVIGRGGSTGTFTMTAGTINKDANGALIFGQGQGVGEFDISGGTLTTTGEYWLGVDNGTLATNNISGTAQMNIHNWVTVGRNGTGVVNMSGGQFNSDSQAFIVGIWAGCQGIWNQSGGSLYVNQDMWIGQGATNAYGTINLTGGTITNTGWLAVGREGAHGVLNISGGTMVKAGVGNNISIAHNSGASGDVTISGTGTFLCLSGETWVGENAAPGTWTMNGGTAVLGMVRLAENADATGVMTLNGGSLTATEITTGNTGATLRELDLNGGTLIAGADNASFIHDLTAANVKTGGAIFNTSGHAVSVNQALLGTAGDGGLTKNGNGALYLNGANTYTGATAVKAGMLGGNGSIQSPVTVSTGATLGAGTSSIGALAISNTLSFAAGSQAFFKLAPGTNDQIVGLTGVSYNGALVISNTTGASLAGSVFKLFKSASAGTGNFTSVTILPSGTGVFNPATGVLIIPGFSSTTTSGGKTILTGVGGLPGAGYTVLTSTNVALPIASWKTNTTGVLDASGAFSNAIPINASEPERFFRIRLP